MKLRILLSCLAVFAITPLFAAAVDATPKKVGPVSYYGALHTSGGKIIGSKNNQEAMIRGMSLFWSDATGLPYYKKDVITWAVDNLKIDVFRFAMGITYYDSDAGTKDKLDGQYSYSSSPESYMTVLDRMVEAAIENDVYIIVDWHSHRAEHEQSIANTFFTKVSQKYANVPNIIYEIYNEPVNTSWGTITSYANAISGAIRKNTQNLILVGTPQWSQLTQYGGVNGGNIGYVFHFYAGTHSTGTFSSRITSAKNSGNPVFITEWGTVSADGKGNANEGATKSWLDFMESNRISNCNWSLRQRMSLDQKDETSAMFNGSEELTSQGLLASATYSASGTIVKNYLTQHKQSWADSLTKGKHSGSCAFNHTTAKETDGQISNVLKGGCTYTSSNENVVSVSGSNISIHKSGYSILTGNDGSQSIVTIQEVAGQTIPNFSDMFCRYSTGATHSCSIGRGANYSGTHSNNDTFDWVLGLEKKTLEGASYTIKSLNPDIVDVKSAQCKDKTYCSTNQSAAGTIVMYEFKKYGDAKIVATAPAVAGYRAMNDTITVSFRKDLNRITSKFDKQYLLGGQASPEGSAPEKSLLGDPVTYTFNYDGVNFSETCPYLSLSGTTFVAGYSNAIIYVKATIAETANRELFTKTIKVIVGDSTQAVNLKEISIPKIKREFANGITAQFFNNGLMINSKNSSNIHLSVFNANGKEVYSKELKLNLGTRFVSLKGLESGSYFARITQNNQQNHIKFLKN